MARNKITRMLKPERLWLQFTHPPKRAYCSLCRRTTWHIRTDRSPRIGTRCLSCHSTAHHRGVYTLIRQRFGANLACLRGGTVYEASHHGALFHRLRKDASRVGFAFFSSEYMPSKPTGELFDGIRNENLEDLTFANGFMDLVTSTGVMEHVEHDELAFREIHRILKPGGLYIFTVPFSYKREATTIRATRNPDGSIQHIMKPEYHGDPFVGDRGVFTWRNYGRDLLSLLSRAGFLASIERVALPKLSEPMPVFMAKKPIS